MVAILIPGAKVKKTSVGGEGGEGGGEGEEEEGMLVGRLEK